MSRHDHDHASHGHAGHGHGGHGHQGHGHAPKGFGRAFAAGIALNLVFVAVEAGYGFWSNSVALLADAGHNLSDVLSLALAWTAAALSARRPSYRYTYGLGASSILAALFNAMLLLLAVGAIAWEAIGRLAHPEPVQGPVVIAVAAVGIVINTATALLFLRGRKDDLNIRGAFLHMAADAAVSAGVVVAGFAILYTGWLWLDPAASLLIVAVILYGTWGLLKESVSMSLAAVPPRVEPLRVREHLEALPGVSAIHDLHIWPISTTQVALTCHLVMPSGSTGDGFLSEVATQLADRFGIDHATIQIEASEEAACRLAPDEVV